MPKIYFLNHPVNEPRYLKSRTKRNIVSVPWNCTLSHKRKFIVREGQYLSGGKIIKDSLYFWGEYEPDTQAVLVNKTAPRAVHNILHPAHVVSCPSKEENTDPYVFGMFRNICCRRRNTVYKPDDVLVFGRMDDVKNILEIDTVLVVESIDKIRNIPTNSQYYYASVLPLCPYIPTDFIEGKLYSLDDMYFSFVPCLPAKRVNGIGLTKHKIAAGHYCKPQLQLGLLGTKAHKNKMCKAVQLTPNNWSIIIDSVHTAGLELGIYIKKI